MGSVLSIVHSPVTLVDAILRAGVALAADAFYPFGPYYRDAVASLVSFCEPDDSEPFDDLTHVLLDLSPDDPEIDSSLHRRHVRRTALLQQPQSTVWRSRTVQAKRLHLAVAKQAQLKAAYFRRRYTLYGPPDWIDPASSLLPPEALCPPTFVPNLIPSAFSYIAPHILLSPPADDPDITHPAANCIPCQNEAFGNRLVVALAPSRSGPRPVIRNPAPPRRASVSVETPTLVFSDPSSASSSSSSPPPTPVHGASFPAAGREKTPTFWIEEDDDALPDLPDTWVRTPNRFPRLSSHDSGS